MEREIEVFGEYLGRHRFKMTQERRAILEEALSSPGHFDADDLLLRFRNRGRQVSRATIYRTLFHLVKSGLLRKIVVGKGQALSVVRLGLIQLPLLSGQCAQVVVEDNHARHVSHLIGGVG